MNREANDRTRRAVLKANPSDVVDWLKTVSPESIASALDDVRRRREALDREESSLLELQRFANSLQAQD